MYAIFRLIARFVSRQKVPYFNVSRQNILKFWNYWNACWHSPMHYCNLFKPAITAHSHCRSLCVIFSLTAVVVCEPISLSLSQFVSPSPSHYHAWDELWTLNKILWTKLSLTHSASLLLSLTRSGCFWLSLAHSGSLSDSLFHFLLTPAHSDSVWFTLAHWLTRSLLGS